MRVVKGRALENRMRVVEAASVLFRERGYDAVGVIELMAAAGLTAGGFYNHFESKSALMVEATAWGLSRMRHNASANDFINFYLSRGHRDARGKGCGIAALAGEAARQGDGIKSALHAGIESLVANLASNLPQSGGKEARAKALSLLAHAVGAVVLSRACPDSSSLADEVLEVCRIELLESVQPAKSDL